MSDEPHQHTPIPSLTGPVDGFALVWHLCECGVVGIQPAETNLIYWRQRSGDNYAPAGMTVHIKEPK